MSASGGFYVGPDDEPDRFRLRRQVASGGEAELWEAEFPFAGGWETVAVKVLHADHLEDVDRWRTRWAEQVDLLHLIRHPSIVGVHGHFKGPPMHEAGKADWSRHALYLVMNWVDGDDLRTWVPLHTAPGDRFEGLRYLTQIASVLDLLHSGKATPSRRPVVHGDLSPANVVINTDGQAVLVDFGFFRIARHVTQLPVGTLGYCAPEVLRDGKYGPESDRYAFGGLAYYVLTGAHPSPDARKMRVDVARIASAGDRQANVDRLAAIFSDDPGGRPPAGQWIKELQLQSSTASIGLMPLPPQQPGGPTVPVGNRAEDGRARRDVSSRRHSSVWLTIAVSLAAIAVVVSIVIAALSFVRNPTIGSLSLGNSPTPFNSPSQVPSSSPAKPPTATYLADLSSLGYEDWTSGRVILDGRVYEHGISARLYDFACTASQEYALSARYSRFLGVAGFADESPNTGPTPVKVKLDGETVLSGTFDLRKPVQIDLDVHGTVRLGIEFGRSGCRGAIVALGDPRLLPNG